MDFSSADSLVLVGLLAAAAALLAIAELIRIPYPIPLVLGGLALGFVPGMPRIELPPDIVLVAVLPPLLYGAAFFSPLRELRANVRPIGLLAIGLVLTTTVAVAAVAHAAIPGLGWPTAFVLGAIVSPTDPTAATAIAQRVGLPRRLIALVEGESLVNDGTALVAYRFAVAAVVTGSFSLAAASGRFLLSIAGGIAMGLAVGYVIREVRRRLDNPPVEITISILSGYFAYLPAEAVGVSGVLSAVTVGIYMGWHTPELTTAQTRLQGVAVWEILFFLLNAFLFTMIGLQLPVILDGLAGYSTATLLWYAVLVAATVVGARFAWIFATAQLPRLLGRSQGSGTVATERRPRLVGHARRGIARGCARPATHDGRGHSVPEPRADRVPDLQRHLGDRRRSGLDPAEADRRPRARGRQRARGEGGHEGANSRSRRRPGPPGGARRRRVGSRRHGRPATRSVWLPPLPLQSPLR